MNSREIIGVDEALERLQGGALMLACDTAAARRWRRRYARGGAPAAERRAWVSPAPAIDALDAWALRLGDDLDAPPPLDRLQEEWIWRRAIGGDEPRTLMSAAALARLAMRAHRTMMDYRIDIDELRGDEEGEALARWLARARRAAAELSPSRLLRADAPDAVLALLRDMRDARACLPDQVLVAGMEEAVPRQREWLEALAQLGVNCLFVQEEASDGMTPAQVLDADDRAGECGWIAAQVRRVLEREPQARVLIAVPDPMEWRAPLEAALVRALAPRLLLESEGGDLAVDWSVRARRMPAQVAEALFVLDLAGREAWSGADMCRWMAMLRDALLARADADGAEEEACEARRWPRLEARLRRENVHRFALAALMDSPLLADWPVLRRKLGWMRDFARQARDGRGRRARDWIAAADGLLARIGWLPETECRDPARAAGVNAFREALNRMIALDAVAGAMRWLDALDALRALCAEAEAGGARRAAVRVRGWDEVGGEEADWLFVAGMDDEAWPLQVAPDPLLPVHAQIAHRAPRANAALAMQESRRMLRRLREALAGEARERWFVSFASQHEGQPRGAAPWLGTAAGGKAESNGVAPTGVAFAVARREALPEAFAPPEDAALKGGAQLYRDQAACPFRAFVRWRLDAAPLEATMPGVPHAMRGVLVHGALKRIWDELRDSAGLHDAIAQGRLEALVGRAAEDAWREVRHWPDAISRRLETARIKALLLAWLTEIEAKRPPFRVIARERGMDVAVPGEDGCVTLSLKIDRVDRVDGREIVIDYKTGRRVSKTGWEGERPEAPQLPLYALARRWGGESDPDGVVFAFLRAAKRERGFVGLAREEGWLPGVEETAWDARLSEWAGALRALTDELLRGDARIAPKDEKACKDCAARDACRIDEAGWRIAEADDER